MNCRCITAGRLLGLAWRDGRQSLESSVHPVCARRLCRLVVSKATSLHQRIMPNYSPHTHEVYRRKTCVNRSNRQRLKSVQLEKDVSQKMRYKTQQQNRSSHSFQFHIENCCSSSNHILRLTEKLYQSKHCKQCVTFN